MNGRMKLVGLTLLAIGLSGCATMSGDECMTSDWSAIGYEDGSRGFLTERFGQHRKACAKHGVTPNFADYQSGRDQGLVEYCQPHRGFNIGSSGGGYNGVCSVELEGGFLDAYNTGHQLYTLRSSVNGATSAIHSKEDELERIEDRLLAIGVELIADGTTKEQRIRLLAEMKDLSERTGQLETEVKDLYAVRAGAQADLEHFQIVVADLGY